MPMLADKWPNYSLGYIWNSFGIWGVFPDILNKLFFLEKLKIWYLGKIKIKTLEFF